MSKQAEGTASSSSGAPGGAAASNAVNNSDMNIGEDISMNRIIDFLRDQ